MAAMLQVESNLTENSALREIEEQFLVFARMRAVGRDPADAMRRGQFAAVPGAGEADLFGSLDIAYAAFILRVLDEITDTAGRMAWIDHILSFQSDDGWFRARDAQKHGVEHATAYALGALQILSDNNGARLAKRLKPFGGLASQIAPNPGSSVAPFELGWLDRIHFWRGSHRAGGIPAIVGATRDLQLPTADFLGIDDAERWLAGWWEYFVDRVSPETGFWRLGPSPAHAAFDLLYQGRHDPKLAAMGGAVHLYWISERMGLKAPYPSETVRATARLLRPSGLYENEPYCIDLDGNFLIARALRHAQCSTTLYGEGSNALAKNRAAVIAWFASTPAAQWNRNSHKLPGAFAAIAEADRFFRASRWRDVFETTWWL